MPDFDDTVPAQCWFHDGDFLDIQVRDPPPDRLYSQMFGRTYAWNLRGMIETVTGESVALYTEGWAL